MIFADSIAKPMRLSHRFPTIGPTAITLIFVAVSNLSCQDRAETAAEVSQKSAAVDENRKTAATAEQRFLAQLKAGRAGRAKRIELDRPLNDPELIGRLTAQDDWLGELVLDEGVVGDSEIASIARLPELWHLRLRESPITDTGMRQLAECRTLKIVNLPQLAATSDGVAALKSLPDLSNLRLGGQGLGGEVADAISQLKTLRSVHLIGVPIDDRGLRKIASLPKLRSLYLDDSDVTEAGWDWLFAEHADLHVHINQQHLDRDPSGHSH